MKLNTQGYRLICMFEGFSAKPYLCSAKVPTIGYGNCYYLNGKKVTLLDKPITELEAFEMFKAIADKFADKVSKLVTSPLDQGQFNALVSLTYNIGPANFQKSTLLRKVNFNHNDPSIRAEFLKWNKAGGQVLKGLTIRRKAEADIYFGE
jgi:lysozyme